VFGGDAEYARARSPWNLVRENADKIRGRMFVRIHVGAKDGLREWNTEFHDLLATLGIEHDWSTIANSTHNPAEFFANWPGNLFDFYANAFAGAAPGTVSEADTREFVYKKTPQGNLRIHVHLPKGWTAGDKRPAIVFFFGGAWRQGTVEQFHPQAEYLAQRGMVTARADYRVRSRHGTAPDKCVEDAKSAVRWLRANAARLGVDPERIVASGGSAGGHIAACTFTVPGFEAASEDTSVSSRPNLLVLFNPVLNCVPIGERFGMGEMARRISPNHHLSKDIPATIIFFGTEDRLNEGGKEFMCEAEKLGLCAQMYMAPGQPHGFFNRSPWREQTILLMDRFLAANGYLQRDPALQLPVGGLSMTKYEGDDRQ
jgi:acetyl esterase